MLLHSHGQPGKREKTNLNGLVREAVHLVYHGQRARNMDFNITIVEDYDETIGEIEVVPQELSRVFLNIANNACYAAHAKAKDGAPPDFAPELRVSTKQGASTIQVRLRDNGSGLSSEAISKVFEPFYTTKPAGEGTGLGLSMSYEIVVQQHGGDLRVESVPGEYAEFIVTLPQKP